MKAMTKRAIVASFVISSGVLIFWISGTPWMRGPNAAFACTETLLALLASMIAPFYMDD